MVQAAAVNHARRDDDRSIRTSGTVSAPRSGESGGPIVSRGPQLRSMKTFFTSVYRSRADIPSSRPMPDIL
jgi:hypothetical protein